MHGRSAATRPKGGGYTHIHTAIDAYSRLAYCEFAGAEIVCAHAPGYVGYDRYDDLVAQHAVSHHFVADGSGVRELRTPWRYVWPSELDLMARLAGLALTNRWADWNRSPFTGDSKSHISVWHKRP